MRQNDPIVIIEAIYRVECKECNEAVEYDSEFTDIREAMEARDNHIQEHRDGYWDKTPPIPR